VFATGLDKNELGKYLLSYAAQVHPELKGFIEQLTQAHFTKMDIYGEGEIRKITSQLNKDRNKLRKARQNTRPATQTAPS
jgi:hypothetical protein